MDGWMGAQCTQQHIVPPAVGVNNAKIHRNSPQMSTKATVTEGQGGEKRMLQIYINTRAGAAGEVNRVEKCLWSV